MQPTDTAHMEDFSTPRRPLLPTAANFTTLAVVVLAVWWSAAQRDPASSAPAMSRAPAVSAPANPGAALTPAAVEPARWVVLGDARQASDRAATLQPVGYQAGGKH